MVKGISIFVNGQEEKRIEDWTITKEKLAIKPIKYLTRFGRYLAIGWNMEDNHLTLYFNGVDV